MQEHKSVYSTGANDGLIMGAYLSCTFLLESIGMHNVLLLLIGNIMLFGTPILAYIRMSKAYRASREHITFSGIWLHGIITFLCGSLIMGLVMYIYMRFINTTFIVDQIRMVADTYRQLDNEDAQAFAHTFDQMIAKHMLPSPIAIVFGMIWFVSFAGAMLSLVLAIIIKLVNRYKSIISKR